jgi:hypothetical protein
MALQAAAAAFVGECPLICSMRGRPVSGAEGSVRSDLSAAQMILRLLLDLVGERELDLVSLDARVEDLVVEQ